MSYLFNTYLYIPLYNVFIGFIGAFPWIDAGIVVILLTVLVKLVLFPLSQKSVRSQIEMKKIQPEIDEIKIKYKDNIYCKLHTQHLIHGNYKDIPSQELCYHFMKDGKYL